MGAATAERRELSEDPPDEDPPDEGAPDAPGRDVYPGMTGPRGVALSLDECGRRAGVTPEAVGHWVREGRIPLAGYYTRGARAVPLVWSADVADYLAQAPVSATRGLSIAQQWPGVVRRAYAARGLGEPPPLATGEDLPALAQQEAARLRVWGPPDPGPFPHQVPEREYRALYLGLALALDMLGATPENLRAAALDAAGAFGPLLVQLAPELPAELPTQLADALRAAEPRAVLSLVCSTLAMLTEGAIARLSGLAPALFAHLAAGAPADTDTDAPDTGASPTTPTTPDP